MCVTPSALLSTFKRIIVVLLLAGICSSCAKMSYLMDQGRGQWRLLRQARLNQDVLNDPSLSPEIKQKLQQIISYRDYFYRFWQQGPKPIYAKTTLLQEDAVTYLVIASPWNKIEAHQECFPFVGCFPYLGFFERAKAQAHMKKMEAEGKVTYLRPVYAYSSLGHFDDPILSSFFRFDEVELARLVFHELFHSIFFIKNEVNLNEALADVVADSMLPLYFSDRPELAQELAKEQQEDRQQEQKLVKLTEELNRRYAQAPPTLDRAGAESILQTFLQSELRPMVEAACLQQKDHHKQASQACQFKPEEWNNARFVAFLTYQQDQSIIARLMEQQAAQGGTPEERLTRFVSGLRTRYDDYKKDKQARRQTFEEYLMRQLSSP